MKNNSNNKKIVLFSILMIILISNVNAEEIENLYLNIDSYNAENDQFNLNALDSNLQTNSDKINLNLEYLTENDGITDQNSAIDFTIKNSSLNENVNYEYLCTRWEVYAIEFEESTTVCYGNENCCNFVSLVPTRSNWNEDFYLTFGLYGASESNVVSAQIIHVNYNLDVENPYTDIYYSNWKSLSAIFNDNLEQISIEDVMEKIENLRNSDNKIKNIEIKDESGNEIDNLETNDDLDLVFNVTDKDNSNTFTTKSSQGQIIIEINDFKSEDADWNNTEKIEIKTENIELESSLENNGIEAKKIITIEQVDEFLKEDEYFGTIELTVNEEFNKVIYCPDDTINTCRALELCSNGFEGIECYKQENELLTIFVPHFSSIIIALDNSVLNISIDSPDNSTSLATGENVYLNFTTNLSITANYSLDNGQIIDLANGTSFSTLLNGSLGYGVLTNGNHDLQINVKDALGNTAIVNYSFSVNDNTAPGITINTTNNSALSATYFTLPINFSSNEYANISYRINNNDYSDFIDLGDSRAEVINLTVVDGENNLTINVTDFHLNSNLYFFTFNFTEIGTCSDARQNGDETGIDCGGSCDACVAFNVSTDKTSYNLTDTVRITIQYRANSVVNFTVRRQGDVSYRRTLPTLSFNGVASETIENTSNAGNYTINATMYYLNISESKNHTFEVLAPSSNPLSVTISANATTIDEGGSVSFSATISGNTGSVTYRWDFENDGTIDSNDAAPTKTYSSNGTYIVNLTISDTLWNQTDIETITVRKLHNITFFVRDNSTLDAINDAKVKFNDITKNTSSDGKVLFTVNEDQHSVKVTKQGYKTFSKNIDVTKNEEILVNLTEKDETSPQISLISPENDEVIATENVTFKYIATDKSDMTCRLYYGFSESTLSSIKAVNNSVKSNIESKFEVKNLVNGTYQWKVDCIDRESNLNSSAISKFVFNEGAVLNELSVDLDEQDKSTGRIVTQIKEVIESLGELDTKEKETAEAMQLKKILEKAIISIERANRDLHSLKWRRLNDTELKEETQRILDRIENVKKTTPKSFEVVESTEFVKYPNNEDIAEAVSILLNQTNLKFSKKDLKNLIEKNQKLQSLITVTTNARILNMEYLSGNKNTITLIQKTIRSSGNLSNVKYYEIIPKDIAKDLNETELLFDYEIIEKDPVVEIDINKIKGYAYYIKKKVSLEAVEKTKSVLLSKDLKLEKKSFVTGLAIVDNLTSRLVETSDKRLIIEIIIIIMLAAIYLVYSFGGFERLSAMANGKEIKEINTLITSALEEIKNNNYENASSKYKEINSKFNKLEKKKKDQIKSFVVELANKVNLLFINKLADEAMNNIKLNKKIAISNYQKIQSLYKIFPKEYKAEVLKKCLMLHKELNS
jgi:PKD repeat protein